MIKKTHENHFFVKVKKDSGKSGENDQQHVKKIINLLSQNNQLQIISLVQQKIQKQLHRGVIAIFLLQLSKI